MGGGRAQNDRREIARRQDEGQRRPRQGSAEIRVNGSEMQESGTTKWGSGDRPIRGLPYIRSAKISDFFTPSPLSHTVLEATVKKCVFVEDGFKCLRESIFSVFNS